MNKRMIQLFALMAASLVWNLTVASPVQLSQHMVPAYAPASSSNGIASFRPNYRFHPQFARQRAPAPTRQSGWLYPSYPERRADSWSFPVSYRPIVTPWQNSHYSQALAGGYQPYQLVMPMPWMANRRSWMGQRPVPAYPAVLMGYGPLAGLPWGDVPPIALSYPTYYHAQAPREAQHPFQRPDRRYIRGQFATNNLRFRPAPPSLGYAPVASNYPAYNRVPAPRAVQNPFQRPDRYYIRGQFAANKPRFRPAPPSLGYAPVASNYPTYNRAPAPRAAQNPFQRLDRRYIRGQFMAANPRFRQAPSPQRHVAAGYNGPRRMGYRFRPVYPEPLNYAPVAVIQW